MATETRTPPVVRNFKQLPRVEPLTLTHSATDTFKKCPRQYFYSWVLGIKPATGNPIFAFGRAYHKFRESIARRWMENGNNAQDPLLFPMAILEATQLWNKEKPPAAPANDYKAKKWAFLTQDRLIDACKTAFDFWQKDAHIFRSVQIEQPFVVNIGPDEDTSGRWDDVIEWNGSLWVRDHKTSTKKKEYFDRGVEPNDQVSRYLFALHQHTNKNIKGVIFEVMYHEASKAPTMFRSTTSRTEAQIQRWVEEQNHWLAMIKSCRDNDSYPMNETACTFCEYHIVCKQMNENSMISTLKGKLFKFAPYDSMSDV